MPSAHVRAIRTTTILVAMLASIALTLLAPTRAHAANTPGLLDTTFGSSGYVVPNLSSHFDTFRGVVQQPDGKLLAYGYSRDATDSVTEGVLARYTATGALDTTFVGDPSMPGYPFSGIARYRLQSLGTTEFTVAKVMPGGTILVGGLDGSDDAPADYDTLLMRLTSTGALDTSFGCASPPCSGHNTHDKGAGNYDVLLDLTVTGTGGILATGIGYNMDATVLVAKYTASGVLDTAFGGAICPCAGYTQMDPGTTFDSGSWISEDGSGGILVAGEAGNGGDIDLLVARLGANGVLDTAFDGDGAWMGAPGNGVVRFSPGTFNRFGGAVLDAAGTLTLATSSDNNSTGTTRLLRMSTTTGLLDASFGTAGIATTDLLAGGSEVPSKLIAGPAGSYVLFGKGHLTVPNLDEGLTARFTSAGALDTSYGTAGLTTIHSGSLGSALNNGIVLADGRFVGSGTTAGADTEALLAGFTNAADRTAPTIKINGPNDGVVATTNPPITASGDVADDVTAKPKVVINGVTATVIGTKWSARVPMVPGKNVFTAVATDAAGNTASHSVTFTFTDKQAPKLSGSPIKGQSWLADVLRAGLFGSFVIDEPATTTITLLGPAPAKAKHRRVHGKVPKLVVYGTKKYVATHLGLTTWQVRPSKNGKAWLKKLKVGNTKFVVRMTSTDHAKNSKTIDRPVIIRVPKPKPGKKH